MYPLFVATVVLTCRHTPHGVGSVPSSEDKHRSSERVHGAARRAEIPSTIESKPFVWGLAMKGSQQAPSTQMVSTL